MKKLFSLVVLLLMGNLIFAQVDLNQKLPVDKDLFYGKLDNGLTYYVKHNSEPKNRAYLQLVVNAGSVFEDEDQRGLAHMCEHMAFNGTKNFPKHELIKYLESIGMQFGADLNAYTSFDETVYIIEIPLDSIQILNKGLQVLYDWACNVSYETDEINAERGVILEEWRLGRGANERVQRQIFPVELYNSKYAQRLPIGDTAIIKNCPPDNLRRFYKDWYRPDLQAVIVVGDFDAAKVAQQVKELFSKIPKRTEVRKHIYPTIPNHKDILAKVATDKELQYPLFSVIIKHDYSAPVTYKDYKNFIIHDLVTGMLNMRLSEITQDPQSPFSYIGTYYSHLLGHKAMFGLYAIPKSNKILDAVKTASEELQRAKAHGFTQSELERMKKAILSQEKKQYDNRKKISSDKIVNIFHQNFGLAQLPALSFEQEYEIYKELLPLIKLDEVNEDIKKLVTKENTVLTLAAPSNLQVPSEKDIIEAYKKAFNTELEAYKDENITSNLLTNEPKAGKLKTITNDKTTGSIIYKFENGVTVVVKPTDFKDNQIVFSAFSKGGYSLYQNTDLINAKTCADIANSCGVGNFDNIALTKYLSDKNVTVYPTVRAYSEGFEGNSTVDDFETMLQLIYAYFIEPRFDEKGMKTYISRQKVFLENKANNPQAIWQDSLMTNIYGHNPLFKPMDVEDLNKIDLKKAEKIYKERFADPASFTFIFVGNLDMKNIVPLLEKYIGSLPAINNKEKANIQKIEFPKQNKKVYATKGSDPKSLIYTILTGKTKQKYQKAIYLKALSMVMTDSLLDQIREKKQWTYSIFANGKFLNNSSDNYMFSIFYSSAPENVDSANLYIMRIANNLKIYQIPESEMKSTIEKIKREHEVNMRDNKYWLNQLRNMYYTNGKPSFITDFDKVIETLNQKSIQKAAKKYIPNYYMSIILRPEQQ